MQKGPKGERGEEQLSKNDGGVSFVRREGHDAMGTTMRVETPHVTKLSRPDPVPERAPMVHQKAGRRPKLAVIGLNRGIINAGDPLYANALRTATRYRKMRTKELVEYHGHVSAGVGAFIANAALCLAASRFLYEKVAELGDLSLLRQASQLADSARQHELAAWELCAREAIARRKVAASANGTPWLKTLDAGEAKRGPKTMPTSQVGLPPVGSSLEPFVQAEIVMGDNDKQEDDDDA
jgi:hypothetical protein